MICKRCGSEFGEGVVCQHCGADKVAARGEFIGYTEPESSQEAHRVPLPQGPPCVESIPFMVCWKCGEVIPGDSENCPLCGTLQFASCPKCGHKYSMRFPYCNKCGTNREKYLLQQKKQKEEEERQRRLQEEKERRAKEKEERKKEITDEQRSLWPVKVVIVTFALMLPVALVLRSIIGVGFSFWLVVIISVIGAVIITFIWDAIERGQ